MKICRVCQVTKELSSFYKHNGTKDGHRHDCKSCHIFKQLSRRDKTKRKEYARKYYLENKEQVKQAVLEYKEDNLDTVKARQRDYNRRQRAIDPAAYKIRARGYMLKRNYGLTLEDYDELLQAQEGCCALCRRHHTEFPRPLAVDHSHRNLRIRGLLCTACNYRLVAKHEDGDLLRRIADYIEQGTDRYVPEPKKKKRTRRSRKVSDG